MLQADKPQTAFFPNSPRSRPPPCAVLALPVAAQAQLLSIRALHAPPAPPPSLPEDGTAVGSGWWLQVRRPFLVLWDSSRCEMVDYCRGYGGVYFQARTDSQNKSTSGCGQAEEEKGGVSRWYVRLSDSYRRARCVYFYFRSQELPQLKKVIAELARLPLTQFDIMRQYTPVRKLGKSGVPGVYLYQCLLKGSQESRCVKSFLKSLYFQQFNGLGKAALRREVEVITKCDHQNICRFEGLFEGDNTVYLVMKHYPMTLRQFLRQLTPPRTLTIFRDLLRGLAYLHRLGIMHRDLKLENIVVEVASEGGSEGGSGGARAAIIDFGVAQYIDADCYLFSRCGTPGYMAPESFECVRSASPEKADIFSLGVVFFIMLFQRHLFAGQSENDILNNNKSARFDAAPSDFATLPPHTQDLLQSMLELDVHKRISARAALQHPALAQIGGEDSFAGEQVGESVASEAEPTQ